MNLNEYHLKNAMAESSNTLNKGEIHIMQKSKWLLGAALAISLGVAGCGKEQKTVIGNGEPLDTIVAEGFEDAALMRVNGRPVTQYDFNLWQLYTKQKHATPESERALLDMIVETELMYQKGLELGLDKDPSYVRAFTLAAAKTKMLRLQDMQERVAKYEADKVTISDEQAQAYYNANEAVIRGIYHLGSLQFPNEKEAKAILKRIRKGESFEVVADSVVTNMPDYSPNRETKEYWDIGEITWTRIPPNVMEKLAKLEVGNVSEPINVGEAGYIILKLLGKEDRADGDFPSVRGEIISILKEKVVNENMDKLRRELKDKAKIEKIASPLAVNMAPAPSTH